MDETFWDKFLDFINWWAISRFFEYWVYPGYSWQNLLFHRYDRLKLPQVKPWEYTDVDYFMLCANMELIVKFIEKEHPEKRVMWYKDENGADAGHKYGEYKNQQWMFPQLNDQWIMDLIKEIYNWWKVEYPQLQSDHDYLLMFWADYLLGDTTFREIAGKQQLYEMGFDKSNTIKNVELLKKIDGINWDILHKYFPNEVDIVNENIVHNKINEIDNLIFNKHQYYLHLCIEVRPYLWT